jgi:asparagine synthase (glutamine-hydrolysing)
MQLPTTKETWETHIAKLQASTHVTTADKTTWAKKLAQGIEQTILSQAQQVLREQQKIGLLFSGGIDSTLIGFVLKKHNISFLAVTVGFQDSDEQKLPDDIVQARTIAQELGFEHQEILLDFSTSKTIFKKSVDVLGKTYANAVNVGVGSVEYAGIAALTAKGIHHVLGGLGSEELFAGYLRHKQAEQKHDECWNGLTNMFERDLQREFAIANHFGITLWAPFLDETLISLAMSIPIEYKLDEQESKIILRDAAEELGLPNHIARRPKQAAQYGSRTDKALDKLAKKHGFKYKKEFIDYLIHHEHEHRKL